MWIDWDDINRALSIRVKPPRYFRSRPDLTSICELVKHRKKQHSYANGKFNWVTCSYCWEHLEGSRPSALDIVDWEIQAKMPVLTKIIESESPFFKYLKG